MVTRAVKIRGGKVKNSKRAPKNKKNNLFVKLPDNFPDDPFSLSQLDCRMYRSLKFDIKQIEN